MPARRTQRKSGTKKARTKAVAKKTAAKNGAAAAKKNGATALPDYMDLSDPQKKKIAGEYQARLALKVALADAVMDTLQVRTKVTAAQEALVEVEKKTQQIETALASKNGEIGKLIHSFAAAHGIDPEGSTGNWTFEVDTQRFVKRV